MESFGVNRTVNKPVQLVICQHQAIEVGITIPAGTGEIKQGTILGQLSNSFLFKPYISTNTDGSENARAILKYEIDATVEEIKTVAYVHGVFNRNDLKGLDKNAELSLFDKGVYIKEVF